ncbi:RecQ family ATP-dependent DNA helicase [Reichenbachiella agariperforans]|uniref:RecQ family ATP-dependent DNA helicase n=1 Tax=Reichenbachiella agariperforans TaxID=156994 RepID=UPI001C0A1963|nr:ATP-dependent DNA helicase RecQ [Reichenbachiella agariperforans]MBU2912731.1 RecQ family ATP-dependent DNA helicase [Reichenbachiella agariperforans]
MTSALDILKKYWGYDEFRPMQQEIIDSVIAGEDTLALLPTGGGKSICFQVPGMMMEGMCLVISPLVALMNDQVYQLKKRGIPAAALYSGLQHRQIDVLLDNCVHGQVKFLYVAPERLSSELFIARVKQMKVSMVAIDEAHCISQWGYDFRPAYQEIAQVYPLLPEVKRIALTATATKVVKEDICEKLAFEKPVVFQKSFARKNLSYSVFELENKGPKLLEILTNVKGSAIVYVRSRKETENVAKFLYQNGISSEFYHAGLAQDVRERKQEEWIKNQRRVMVCTNAFGMGIDKPDVRVVVHLDLPDSLESYYQEAGRAGRDERNAFAVLLYSPTDIYNLQRSEEMRNPALAYVERIYQALANYYKLATGSSEWQSFDFDLKEFSYRYKLSPLEAHHAVKKLQEMGLLLLTENVSRGSSLKINVSSSEIYKFSIAHGKYEPLIKAMLRLYGGGLYSDFFNISEFELAKLSHDAKNEVFKKLDYLAKNGIVLYDPLKNKPQLTYVMPRQEQSTLKRYHKQTEPRQAVVKEKVGQMVSYAKNRTLCRTRIFQEYFDEVAYLNCGVCDVCIKAKKEDGFGAEMGKIQRAILKQVESGDQRLQAVKQSSNTTNDFLFTEAVRQLMDDGVIFLTEDQKIAMVPRV